MHRRSIGINVGFIHWLCGVLIILVWSGIFLTDAVGEPIRLPGFHFSEQPIPCRVYLEKKRIHEESGEKGGSYVLGSFFQAEVQVVRNESKTIISPQGYPWEQMLTIVRVVEVLEGTVPEQEFPVYYSQHYIMPPSEKHYFILGNLGRSEDGTNVSLVRVEGSFTKKKMGGGQPWKDGFRL
ncbi:MAG: hypothetical protein AB7T38_10880 [Nitrospirales bacterium]